MKNMSVYSWVGFFFSLILVHGCNQVDTSKFSKGNINGVEANTGSSLSFAGVQSIDQVTDTSLRLNWNTNPNATAYQIHIIGTSVSYAGTVIHPAANFTVTGLTPNRSYTFRVRVIDSNGLSDSNNVNLAVTTLSAPPVISCPSGYIPVPANSSVGTTSGFCVMKYEAKNVAGVATSQATLTPWVNISHDDAKAACSALGADYDIISNAEWMTVAREIEKTPSNWTGGAVGSGSLYIGHSDNNPAAALAVSDVTNPYVGTGNTSSQGLGNGKEQRRTHELSNGEVIWDFAGNLLERVDWSPWGLMNTVSTTNCPSYGGELLTSNCTDISPEKIFPANPSGVASVDYNTRYGVGYAYLGPTASSVVTRGGFWGNFDQSGVFHIQAWSSDPVGGGGAVFTGFRCVYRAYSGTSPIPPVVSYAQTPGTSGFANNAFMIKPTTLISNGAPITSCTSSPALPAGLTINPSTCVISGTPTTGTSATYQITASNSAGDSASASLTITVTLLRQLGDLALGGMIAYILQPGDPGYDANVQHGIVISVNGSNVPDYVGYAGPVQGGPGAANVSYDSITSAEIGTGLTNSNNLIAFVPTLSSGWTASAALTARAHNGGGYTDWALPSLNDILAMRSSNIASVNALWNYQSSTSTTCGWPNYAYIGCFHYYLSWPNPWAYRLMAGWSAANVVAVRYF
jgi:hypothetical protein